MGKSVTKDVNIIIEGSTGNWCLATKGAVWILEDLLSMFLLAQLVNGYFVGLSFTSSLALLLKEKGI